MEKKVTKVQRSSLRLKSDHYIIKIYIIVYRIAHGALISIWHTLGSYAFYARITVNTNVHLQEDVTL